MMLRFHHVAIPAEGTYELPGDWAIRQTWYDVVDGLIHMVVTEPVWETSEPSGWSDSA